MHTTAKVIKLVASAVLIVALIAAALWKIAADRPLLPDRAPNAEEHAEHAQTGADKLPAPADGGALRLNYEKEVTIDLSDGTASLLFENGGESLQDVSIFLVVQDTLILQSGLLSPGSTLRELPLPPDGIPLQRGGYDGEIIVQFYDDNGDALSVNSRLQGINIEVK